MFSIPSLPVQNRSNISLEGVTIINPKQNKFENASLSIEDGIITRSPVRMINEGYSGYFALPGFIDMHVHTTFLPGDENIFFNLYLMHGITAVRNMGDGGMCFKTREEIQKGFKVGPRIFGAGEILDAPPSALVTRKIKSKEEASSACQDLFNRGADFFKVFPNLSGDSLKEVISQARKFGIKVAGHSNQELGIEGQHIDDIQHLTGLPQGKIPGFDPCYERIVLSKWEEITDDIIKRAITTAKNDGASHTPTLVANSMLASFHDNSQGPPLHLLPDWYKNHLWNPSYLHHFNKSICEKAFNILPIALKIVKKMHDANIPLYIGTDVFAPFVVPGASHWEEMRLFRKAGIPAEDILSYCTNVPAKFFTKPGTPKIGVIEEGAVADLLLFKKNPAESLDNLDSLEAIITNGRMYTREELIAMNAKQLKASNSFGLRTISYFLIKLVHKFICNN